MKLYYAIGSCSLAPHIALREAELAFTMERYDIKTGELESGGDLLDVNDKGYVPVLEFDDGERLTEVAAILQYIADRRPDSNLAPVAGTLARYRLQELLNFIATEIHKIFWPIFHDGSEQEKVSARARLLKSYGWVERRLGEGPYLMGEQFTVADCFLFAALSWARPGGVDLGAMPGLAAYTARVRKRPAVEQARRAEGLLR